MDSARFLYRAKEHSTIDDYASEFGPLGKYRRYEPFKGFLDASLITPNTIILLEYGHLLRIEGKTQQRTSVVEYGVELLGRTHVRAGKLRTTYTAELRKKDVSSQSLGFGSAPDRGTPKDILDNHLWLWSFYNPKNSSSR